MKASPMTQTNDSESNINWALPQGIAEPDQLVAQINVYSESIILRIIQHDATYVRMVSADGLAHALNGEVNIMSGLLPKDAIWWQSNALRPAVALWREPAVWNTALQTQPFEPPKRYAIPMPGLIFICAPSQAPWILAAKHRPRTPQEQLYKAPTFNTFRDGRVCPGTHQFPPEVDQIPESFFTSFFSMTGDVRNRSSKHPDNLLDLWNELDGLDQYPMDDLVPAYTVAEAMQLQSE